MDQESKCCSRFRTCEECNYRFCGLCATDKSGCIKKCSVCKKGICIHCYKEWGNDIFCQGCQHMKYISDVESAANSSEISLLRDISRKSCKLCKKCHRWKYGIKKCRCNVFDT